MKEPRVDSTLREKKKSEAKGPHTVRDSLDAYFFAASAIFPWGSTPLFAISSPRFRIGIPLINSITKTLLTKQRKNDQQKVSSSDSIVSVIQ